MRRTKLTLSIEKSIVERAKKLASRQGTSLSSMISRYLAALLQPRRGRLVMGPITRSATGLVKLPSGKSDRQLLEEALAERYGL